MTQRHAFAGRLRAAPLFAGLALALGLDRPANGAADPKPPAIVVANCNDGGAGSLRAAVLVASEGETVDLSQLSCSTITLSSGQIDVDRDDLFITGPGAGALTINGGTNPAYANRIFRHLGNGTLTIEGLTIAHGSRPYDDTTEGGCLFSNGNIHMFQSVVDACSVAASGPGEARGGAISVRGEATLFESTVSESLVSSETSQAMGGGIYAPALNAKYSTIANNVALGNDQYGGVGGGFYWGGGGDIYFLATTVSGNSAFDYGGLAVRALGSGHSIRIYNSTISANRATFAGGGAVFQVPATISNSTIAFNSVEQPSSPAGLSINAAVTVTLESTIVAMNLGAGMPADIEVATAGAIAGTHNLIVATDAPLPPDTIRDCPNLTPLAANGGLTRTNSLLPGSPAIDQGSNTVPLPNDQRGDGFARVVGATADIGAFERQGNGNGFIFAGDFENPRCP
jgi:hypothetical protein